MVFWRKHSTRRYYETSVSPAIMFGLSTDINGTWTLSVGPFELWTHRL